MQILRADGYRRMPWKNGGGSTAEIAAAPEGAGLDAFDWRISMATVAVDGPFSSFPGVDRTLSILQGAGLVLHGLGPQAVRLDGATEPFPFPADAAVSARLVDGPVIDLNVMTRRGRSRNVVRRLVGTAGTVVSPEGAVAFLLADAPCRVELDHAAPVALGRWDALRLDGPAGRRMTVAADGAVAAFLIELFVDAGP